MKKFIIILLLLFAFPVLGANTKSIQFVRSSSQYAYIENNASLSVTGDITVEAWINVDNFPSGTDAPIVGKYHYSGDQRAWFFSVLDNGGTLRFFVDSTGQGLSASQADWTFTADSDTWYHVAVTYDASEHSAELFIDNVSQGAGDVLETSIFNSSARTYVGTLSNGANGYWDGLIDEVRIWGDIRTDQEIEDNYKTEDPAGDNLIAYWKFNDSALDETNNDNDLTLVNSPTYSTDIPDWAPPTVEGFNSVKIID